MSDGTVALDGKWPCCDHCRHGVHARRDGHFHACKWCQRPDGQATAVSDPNLRPVPWEQRASLRMERTSEPWHCAGCWSVFDDHRCHATAVRR